MRVFDEIIPEKNKTAVALGYFDGIHLGHRDVLGSAAAQAKNGLVPVCLTFSKSPRSVLGGEPLNSIMTRDDKIRALESLGIEQVCFADFKSLMNLSARDFAERILFGALNAQRLFCGFNYRFGKDAEGDTGLLSELCALRGAELTVLPPRRIDGDVVSSSRIKLLLHQGKLIKANELLCGRFGFRGEVIHGKRLGRELGAPTINMAVPEGMLLPRFGVYASSVTLENGEEYCGVTNVGIKPTVGGVRPGWETWMPDYSGGELYGQKADVRLLDFIRAEKRFPGLEELKQNILADSETAKKIYLSIEAK